MGNAAKNLFIDGAFFQGNIEEMKALIEPEAGPMRINFSMAGGGCDRVLYYDAYPEWNERDDPDQVRFKADMTAARTRFDEISRLRNFHVRPALTRRGRRQEQKGVDVLLATECLMHSLRENIDEAAVITSDLDFFPLFEALLQTKTRSTLYYQPGRTNPELLSVVDFSVPLHADQFLSWVEGRQDLKEQLGYRDQDLRNFEVIRSGICSNECVDIMRDPDQGGFVPVINGRGIGPGRRFQCIAELQLENYKGTRIVFRD